jgi:hypothetical protein
MKPTIKVFGKSDFDWNTDFKIIDVKDYRDADVVAFPGGSDVNPKFYNRKNSKSYVSDWSTKDDAAKFEIMKYCVENNIALTGNCRGFQQLGVFAGFALLQDVRHSGTHLITCYDGEKIVTNSLHHQMVNLSDPYKDNAKVIPLAWAENLSYTHYGEDGEFNFPENAIKEIEIAYFPEINALGQQGHLEWGGTNEQGYDWIKKQYRKYLKLKCFGNKTWNEHFKEQSFTVQNSYYERY